MMFFVAKKRKLVLKLFVMSDMLEMGDGNKEHRNGSSMESNDEP